MGGMMAGGAAKPADDGLDALKQQALDRIDIMGSEAATSSE